MLTLRNDDGVLQVKPSYASVSQCARYLSSPISFPTEFNCLLVQD